MIQFGIDRILTSSPSWKTQRIALLTNHAATTNRLVPSRKALIDHGFHLVKLFSPEHGLSVTGADGHLIKDGTDALTGLPITSLYSEKLAPSAEDFSDIAIVLFDIPDVGSRFYTYLWTMSYMMEACAQHGKKLIILDRPNPVSGNMQLAEGPMLDETEASFIGRWSIPVRHSCTLGELADYFNRSRNIQCNLEVIRCENWNRNQFQTDWGIDFIATSPAIQDFQSMLLYPGLCLLEATNICEGRSTRYSFTSATAPWIDGKQVAAIMNDMELDVTASPVNYVPADGKYAGQTCTGIHLKVSNPELFQPVFFGMILVKLVKQMYPSWFRWQPYPTLVNPTGEHHLDKLLGIAGSEQLFELPLQRFIAEANKLTTVSSWKETISGSLLYPA